LTPAIEIDWKEIKKYREKGISYSAISRILDIPYSTLIRRKIKINISNVCKIHLKRFSIPPLKEIFLLYEDYLFFDLLEIKI
jgi:hypothetical protein